MDYDQLDSYDSQTEAEWEYNEQHDMKELGKSFEPDLDEGSDHSFTAYLGLIGTIVVFVAGFILGAIIF